MKIYNLGSLNIDYVYSVEHFVTAGETLPSDVMWVFPGGKGLNIFIQSEGLVCNRRRAYVITRSMYGITVGVSSFGLITYHLRLITYTALP